tara:strand:+ start:156 stop:503 length:348 start_codon:yes stop_codon:yes gene_type:complete
VKTPQPDIVTVTKEANQHLSKIITEGNAKGVMLAVDGGGCAGLRYSWELIPSKEEDMSTRDMINLEDGFLYIHPTATLSVLNTTIDFVSDIAGASLRITNPNATSSCGCGESFSI